MTVKKAIEELQKITGRNGYAWTPSCVVESPTKALRGVSVAEKAGKIVVTINAEGRCLEMLKQAIREKLGDAVVFADEKSAQPAANNRSSAPTEESDDVTG